MDSDKLNEAILNYYKLKENNEKKINNKKMKIIKNSSLTNKEKQLKFKQYNNLCVNCKREGGTIFTNKDGILKAVCGRKDDKCNLDIEINRGKYKISSDLLIDLTDKLNKLKTQIIKIKLDYLFGYIGEMDALGKFNNLKAELTFINDQYRNIEIFYINKTDNPEDKSILESAIYNLYSEVQKIKELCDVFKVSSNKILLKTVVENYINLILPLNTQISNLKYIIREIITEEDYKILYQKKNTLSSLEYPLENGKIIVNKK